MLIDSGVYSRNRCFRLLFQSKFGKKATLRPVPGSHLATMHPSMQFLTTMSSFVPEGTPHFRHPLIPVGYAHAAAQGIKLRPSGAPGHSVQGPRVPRVAAGATAAGEQTRLTKFLAEEWDKVRSLNEKGSAVQPSHKAVVTSMHEMSSQFFTVTLGNNNFCFRKGSCHLSNKIYLVVDRNTRAFRQKCYDPDCRHYGSPWFPIPPWFWETSDDEDDLLTNLELPPPEVKKELPPPEVKEPEPEDQRKAPGSDKHQRPGSAACDDDSSSSSSSSSSSRSSSSSLRSNSRSPSPECPERDSKRPRLESAE